MKATNKRKVNTMNKVRKLATLTAEENKAWESAFAFHVNNGASDKRADSLAWKDLCAEFPRLRNFQGCKA
jgi:hypothetical protein